MADIPRLNGAIRALEQGKPAFVTFSAPEISAAQAINAAPYDAVVFEMEHNPYDIRVLRDCMQYMLDRRQILKAGSIAPAVTPMVRIPPNGWELGKKHGSDAQIFLATGEAPSLSIGATARIRIAARGARIRISVDGVPVVDFVDERPLARGSVGLYEEDARVRFGPVRVSAP